MTDTLNRVLRGAALFHENLDPTDEIGEITMKRCAHESMVKRAAAEGRVLTEEPRLVGIYRPHDADIPADVREAYFDRTEFFDGPGTWPSTMGVYLVEANTEPAR